MQIYQIYSRLSLAVGKAKVAPFFVGVDVVLFYEKIFICEVAITFNKKL